MLNKIIFLLAMGMSAASYAMFCPTNFNQVNIGDTKEVVVKACGKPVKETEIEGDSNQPQEWNYYLKLNPTDPASLKSSVGFADGKVTNISVNGVGLTNTTICGTTIQVGDDQEAVKKACGKPAFILQNNGDKKDVQQTTETPKKLELLYESSTGTQTVFVFENGVLVARK